MLHSLVRKCLGTNSSPFLHYSSTQSLSTLGTRKARVTREDLKWMTNKVLLYSTGNSAQCYMAAWMKGEFGRARIHCMYSWVASLFIWNYHTVVLAISQYKTKGFKKELAKRMATCIRKWGECSLAHSVVSCGIPLGKIEGEDVRLINAVLPRMVMYTSKDLC